MKFNRSMAEAMCRALTALGYTLIEAGDFDEALELARDLERMGIYSSYEIAASAYAGKGEVQHAVQILERGVQADPDNWINWELLGSYRSESGDYEGADRAYLKGMQCPGAWMDSITYNRAVARARSGDPRKAMELLDDVVDPDLDEPAAMVRIGLLVELGRPEDALDVVNSCLDRDWGPGAGDVRSRFRQKKVWLLAYMDASQGGQGKSRD